MILLLLFGDRADHCYHDVCEELCSENSTDSNSWSGFQRQVRRGEWGTRKTCPDQTQIFRGISYDPMIITAYFSLKFSDTCESWMCITWWPDSEQQRWKYGSRPWMSFSGCLANDNSLTDSLQKGRWRVWSDLFAVGVFVPWGPGTDYLLCNVWKKQQFMIPGD